MSMRVPITILHITPCAAERSNLDEALLRDGPVRLPSATDDELDVDRVAQD
jgi:hypothetical protein